MAREAAHHHVRTPRELLLLALTTLTAQRTGSRCHPRLDPLDALQAQAVADIHHLRRWWRYRRLRDVQAYRPACPARDRRDEHEERRELRKSFPRLALRAARQEPVRPPLTPSEAKKRRWRRLIRARPSQLAWLTSSFSFPSLRVTICSLRTHPVHLDAPSLLAFRHSFSECDKLVFAGEADDDTLFRFNCFNIEDSHDPTVRLEYGELVVPGNVLRRDVFDPVVGALFLVDHRFC